MPKIMIVDDDIQATTLLEKILSVEGYDSVSVNISANAVQIAKSTNPDLFLIDLMMPDPDGFQLCKILRADPSFSKTPIIIITAMDDNDSRTVAYAAGANDFLTKPFHIDELAVRIKALIF